MKKTKIAFLFCLFFITISINSYSQIIHKLVGIKWHTIDTKHFVIHYHDGLEYTAKKVAAMSDEVYEKVTKMWDYPLHKKIHISLIDYRDRTNGFAIYAMDMINIETPNLYFYAFNLRGRKDWIKDVFTHEFAHIVSLKKSSNLGDRISAFGFNPLSLQDRDGYQIISILPIDGNISPYWWVEGIAQRSSREAGFDRWDSHRNMLLRTATLEDNLLTLDKMSVPGALRRFYSELGYNQGFNLSLYLQEKYGKDVHNRIAKRIREHTHLNFHRAIEKEFQLLFPSLYIDWKRHIEDEYLKIADKISPNLVKGEEITFKTEDDKGADIFEQGEQEFGFASFASGSEDGSVKDANKSENPQAYYQRPGGKYKIIRKTQEEKEYLEKGGINNNYFRMSPDMKWYSYIKDDNLYIKSVKEIIREDGTIMKVGFKAEGVHTYGWSPDSKKLVVSGIFKDGRYFKGYRFHDLAILDISEFLDEFNTSLSSKEFTDVTMTKEFEDVKERATHGARAEEPVWSPDGRFIAFSRNYDGMKKIGVADVTDNYRIYYVLKFTDDTQACTPSWSPDSKKLAITLFKNDKQDIWIMDADGSKLKPVTFDTYDDRDPVWAASGKEIIFVSDRVNGIFNVFSANLKTGKLTQLTNVLSGTFMPFISADTKQILYTKFSSFGFRLYKLERKKAYNKYAGKLNVNYKEAHKSLKTANAYKEVASEKYNEFPPKFRDIIPVQLIPEFVNYNTQFGFGVTGWFEDYLSKHRFTARAYYDEDMILQFKYYNYQWYPEIGLEYDRVENRLDAKNLNLDMDSDGAVDVTTNYAGTYLQDIVEAGMKWPIFGHTVGLYFNFRNLKIHSATAYWGADSTIKDYLVLRNFGADLSWQYSDMDSKKKYDRDISPRGWKIRADYLWTYTQRKTGITNFGYFGFFDPNEYADGHGNYNFHTVLADFEYIWLIPSTSFHTIGLKLNAGAILKDVAPNDEFFLGGKSVFKTFRDISTTYQLPGYDAYSIRGETRLVASLNYRFPIVRNITRSGWFIFLDDIYMNIFADAGNAWAYGKAKNTWWSFDDNLNQVTVSGPMLYYDVGLDILFKSFIWYTTPWYSFISASYGILDTASYGHSDSDWPVRLYVGIGTGF